MLRRRILLPVLGAALLTVGCQSESADTADTTVPQSTVGAAPTDAGVESGLLDPNTASRDELLAVPGMTEAAADSLIARRPYTNMLRADSALAAAQLTEEQREQVYAGVWYPLDLNTASGAEIMLIPGVGERMRHEFEEYRPYRGIAQFRREIGKYVDSAEVARLEQYVTIR
jgi:DNA uptake protein ComE-like DNA-binding protein